MTRKTIRAILRQKGQTPIVALTAYSYPMAKLIDPHVDIMLVGDSLGTALYGMETTLGVSEAMMAAHAKAVMRASTQALVVVDLPFGSYQQSPQQAFQTASTMVKDTGCHAVKLEGGVVMADTIRFIAERGIAVMGHIGLKPQSVLGDGGYRVHGRTPQDRAAILADAKAVAAAGAFAVVVEGVLPDLADEITHEISIPTIGIGASTQCDGQILVTEDMLGLFGENTAKFVRRYATLDETISAAVKTYASDIKERQFPGPDELY